MSWHPRGHGPIQRPQDRLDRPPTPQDVDLARDQKYKKMLREVKEDILEDTGIKIGGGLAQEADGLQGAVAEACVTQAKVDEAADDDHGGTEGFVGDKEEVELRRPVSRRLVEQPEVNVVVETTRGEDRSGTGVALWRRVVGLFRRMLRLK